MARKIYTTLDLNAPLTIAGSGGTAGYSLTTDGSGNVSWTNVSGGGGGASAATPTALGTVYGTTNTTSKTYIGYNSGGSSTGVVIGVGTMTSATSGATNNVVIGDSAFSGGTSAANSVVIGTGAGQNASSSTVASVIIGPNAGPAAGGTTSYKLFIDNQATNLPLIGGDFGTREVTFAGVSQNAFTPILTTLYR